MDEGDLEDLMMFFWACLVSACHADGVELALDYETFIDSLDVETVNSLTVSLQVADEGAKKKTPR